MTEHFYPWFITKCVLELEDNLLKPHFMAFEWGSGKSTIWLAKRVKYVISVEHDKEWYDKVWRWLQDEQIKNVHSVFPASWGGDFTDYVNYILKYVDGFDVVMIDGRRRAQCIRACANRIKPGGFVIVDDSEREQYQEAYEVFDGWRRRDWSDHTGKYTSIFFND